MTLPGGQPYFDGLMLNRQRLLWALATRLQLERWEPYVAASVHAGWSHGEIPDDQIWTAATEHHFALIAARNLIRALELPPPAAAVVDATLRDELIEGRDLHEHWIENMPIFRTTPRTAQPAYPSGKRFAARNPSHGPYSWISWSNKGGPRLLPNVAAEALHELIDAVEAEVLADDPNLSRFVPPRATSPWIRDEAGDWWPKPPSSDP